MGQIITFNADQLLYPAPALSRGMNNRVQLLNSSFTLAIMSSTSQARPPEKSTLSSYLVSKYKTERNGKGKTTVEFCYTLYQEQELEELRNS